MLTRGMNMVGAPGDTYQSILKTFDYIRNMGSVFSGNNSGNDYSVFFGSEVSRDPEAAGLVVEDEVKSSQYPAYLSPGESVLSTSLTPSQMKRIQERRRSEVEAPFARRPL